MSPGLTLAQQQGLATRQHVWAIIADDLRELFGRTGTEAGSHAASCPYCFGGLGNLDFSHHPGMAFKVFLAQCPLLRGEWRALCPDCLVAPQGSHKGDGARRCEMRDGKAWPTGTCKGCGCGRSGQGERAPFHDSRAGFGFGVSPQAGKRCMLYQRSNPVRSLVAMYYKRPGVLAPFLRRFADYQALPQQPDAEGRVPLPTLKAWMVTPFGGCASPFTNVAVFYVLYAKYTDPRTGMWRDMGDALRERREHILDVAKQRR
jgi:hypothetical protein